MNILKLITFDVTGTLVKFQPIPAAFYSHNAKDFGIYVSADAVLSSFKTEWKKLSSEHPNFGAHSGIGWHTWWKILVKNTIVNAEPSLSLEDKRLDQLSELLINEYKTAKWIRLTDGATNILDNLKMAKIPIGVISNYDPRLETLLEAVGIKHYFKFIVTSYAAGIMKPDKKIFKVAESQVLNVQPSNCLHVGNDIELDYKGAVNAGWSAAIIDSKLNNTKTKEIMGANVFSSLNDFLDKLKQENFRNL